MIGRKEMEQWKKKYLKLYIWLTFGILVSIAAGMMKTGGSVHIGEFFQQGKVYEFSPETLRKSTSSCYYDDYTDAFVILTESGRKTFPTIKVNQSWSYISMNIDAMNQPSAEIIFAYYDKEDHKLEQQLDTVVNGENLIPILYPEKFQRLKIFIKNQPGLSFKIQSMQLKESDLGFSNSIFIKTFLIVLALYLAATLLFMGWKRLDWYLPVELLQYSYILFGDYWGSRLAGKLSRHERNRLRTELFFFLFLYNMIFQTLGLYLKSSHYKYGILVNVLTLLLIGLFSWEKPLQYLKWNGILPITWFLLWTGVCISDFVVNKSFRWVGVAFLIGGGFFFFLWNQMEQPKQMRNDMIRGLEWTFPVVLLYCMIFRLRIDGIFYNGFYGEHRDMALYSLIMWIVFLSEIFYYLIYSKAKQKGKWLILYSCGSALSGYLLWQTHVRGCLMAGGAALLLFFYMLFRQKRKYEKKRVIIAAGCCVAVVLTFHFSTAKLPDLWNTNLIYPRERFEINDLVVDKEVWLTKADPEVVSHIRTVTEVHKKAIWKNYLRKLNLFGNTDRLIVYEKETMAYNGLIEMAYRYGIFILIPYVGMLLLCLYRAIREGGYLMLATVLSFDIVLLTQNIEQPFAHPMWIVFYLGMGIWFTQPLIRKDAGSMGERIYKLIEKEKIWDEEENS